MRLMLAYCLFLFSNISFGKAETFEQRWLRTCNRPGMVSIKAPLQYDSSSKAQRDLRFFLKFGSVDPRTVVIFIPGGPGGDYTYKPPSSYDDLLKNHSYVLTGPRGVGCNLLPAGVKIPPDFFSTASVARDVLHLAKDLLSKGYFQSYILWGDSYGTQVATVAAAMAKSAGYPEPTSVVLAGVVAHARRQEYLHGITNEWNKVVDTFHKANQPDLAKAMSKLDKRLKEDPRGGIARGVLDAIDYFAGTGFRDHGYRLLHFAHSVLNQDTDEEKDFYNDVYANLSHRTEIPGRQKFRINVGCYDYSDYSLYPEIAYKETDKRLIMNDFAFSGPYLTIVTLVVSMPCQGAARGKLYKSSDHQITVPIYYLNGLLDPYTPPTEAKEHWDSQKKTALKELFLLHDSGHSFFESLFKACVDPLLAKMKFGLSAGEEFEDCKRQVLPEFSSITDYSQEHHLAFRQKLRESANSDPFTKAVASSDRSPKP